MQRDLESVIDILAAAEAINMFVEKVTFDAFRSNYEKLSAVVFQIAIIGEASKRLSMAFREEHPSIPWTKMAGMRDQLMHGYDKIDLQIVWDAIKIELPPVVQYLRKLLPEDRE